MRPLIVREWRHHPWRHGLAAVAVALGVALAWSVHLINSSALSEFSAAVRSANGEPDAVLRAAGDSRAGMPDSLFDAVEARPEVQTASPVVEVDTYARAADVRKPLRVLGIDVLRAAPLAPALVPRVAKGYDGRYAVLDPGLAFVNAAARRQLALADGARLQLQAGERWVDFEVAGDIAADGAALVVVDLAAAQSRLRGATEGAARLSRIDLRLAPGADIDALQRALGPALQLQAADAAEQRVSNLSRAYRVNLSVLALVALFVGAFLVYSVVSLSVAQRTPGFALLGVLGMTAVQRQRLVLAECGLVGVAGSALGLAAGTAMAVLALRWLAGDLGGGYFPGVAPPLQWQPAGLLGFGAMGVAAALVGGWVPAQHAQSLVPARALKGLGDAGGGAAPPVWPGVMLLAAGAALALLPPVGGLPLAAYASVAALLFGGVALVPVVVQGLVSVVRRAGLGQGGGALWLLAIERAHFHRRTASAAVAGIVASLALCVALTVMVGSFRIAVAQWLDQVLPADLYLRTAASSALAEQAYLEPDFVDRAAMVPGVARISATRHRPLQLDSGRPAVVLVARDLSAPARALAWVEPPAADRAADGGIDLYVSEAMVALYGARVGQALVLPLNLNAGQPLRGTVRGIFRDYARQFGTIAIDLTTYRQLTGDARINDIAVWLTPGAALASVQAGLRAVAPDPAMLEFASATELRRISLAIFDRSFAVTRWLQAVAIGIGLLGIAASLSAQVLARRKEFGLLAHLGLTRRQTLWLVGAETAVWLAAGIVVALLLGAAVSAVLVHVVNPQSFHWTMELVLPPWPLAALAAAVALSGLLTALASARQAATRQVVRSVKEDW